MRLLEETNNPDLAKGLSDLLTDRKIEHKLEHVVNTNWGDDKYGDATYKLWVIDEDLVGRAEELIRLYKIDPRSEAVRIKKTQKKPKEEKAIPLEPDPPKIDSGSTLIIRFVILLTTFLFALQLISTPQEDVKARSGLYTPSLVEETLLYDFPKAAELYTQAFDLYYNPRTETLSRDGQELVVKADSLPYWKGFYPLMTEAHNGDYEATPWFEKIQQGQFWRLITPAFLHGGLLHILFNLLWFWMLGKEIEKTLGAVKTALIIILIALFSNTAQYLMTGYQFLGLSGVVAGFLIFIGERQRIAPWEGYTLEKSVYNFLLIYIFGLALLQVLLFFGALAGMPEPPFSIANTAHIAGAALGFILGRSNFFAWKS